MTDEELVGELTGGSEGALRELLRRYERPLAGFLHRHTGGRDVEDLYQETWTRVVRQASHFARQFGISVTALRLAAVLLTLLGAGWGVIVYVVLWVIMPYGDDSPGGGRATAPQ